MNESTIVFAETRCLSLPGVIIFPGMTLPVQIKSPELLREIENAWRENQLLVLAPHQSAGIGCLVEIRSFQLDHNHYGYVVLHGVNRVRCESVDGVASQIKSVSDNYNGKSQADRVSRREKLLEAINEKLPNSTRKQMLVPALESELPFGLLCDLVATGCQLTPEEYESLLVEQDVDLRCELLCKLMSKARKSSRQNTFPPVFSPN